MIERKRITILDTTLRDGSYPIDFQFTAEDTGRIATALEKAGFDSIEIGHGFGLNASNCGYGIAAATDEEYLEVAHEVLFDAKFGMFFIPGIGREQDLKMAADYDMDFVRIGTNVTEVDESAPYIEIAKNLSMEVSANLMKSYVLPLCEFLKQAKKSESFGADILVVVDSAGSMLPREVSDYVSMLKRNSELPIGFHGHNNFGLAVANALSAIEAGATVIDATLCGMGRSAGNVQTSILVLLLQKLGYFSSIDFYKTMDIAENLVRPLMHKAQEIDSIAIVSGKAEFHSSFLPIVYRTAQRYHIDPRRLIERISDIERVHITEDLAEKVARDYNE